MTDDFFDEQEDQSRIKSIIVSKYLIPWAHILLKYSSKLQYIDLYCGPGRYADGEPSTPILVLQEIVAIPKFARTIATIFNDSEAEFVARLRLEVHALPNIGRLRYEPEFHNELVGDRSKRFFEAGAAPSLTFLDPWGYKGLGRDLFRSVVSGFGCDAIFFFNFNRINAAIENLLVEPHMQSLFDDRRLVALRAELAQCQPEEREPMIMLALGESLNEIGAKYLIPFRFHRPGGRVSHYICFVTKNRRAYGIMKDVMASIGEVDPDGVPLFEYFPPVDGRQLAFGERPLLDLPGMLLRTFSGRSLTVLQIFDEHNVGTPFLKSHYKKVLLELEALKDVTCEPPHRKKGMADHVVVTFP
jgi:three-Cys-motif partner protein